MTEPDLVRWYREQLEVYAAQLAIRDKQLAQVQRALDAANHKIRQLTDTTDDDLESSGPFRHGTGGGRRVVRSGKGMT
jgi:hypothetical protein